MQKRKAAAKDKSTAKVKKSTAKATPAKASAKKAVKKAPVKKASVKKPTIKKSAAKKPASKKTAAKRKSPPSNGSGMLSPNIRRKIESVLTELENLLHTAEKNMMKKFS
jgi:hypothetical protein